MLLHATPRPRPTESAIAADRPPAGRVPQLSVAVEAMLAAPGRPPLVGLLAPVVEWIETRHMALLAESGFDDVRRAHNAVFVHLPSDGRRLTDLARAAGITKQAMGELVDDLVQLGYLEKVADPTDGRAKLIVWAERGEQGHIATMQAFATIERELAALVGEEALDQLAGTLLRLVGAIGLRESGPDDHG